MSNIVDDKLFWKYVELPHGQVIMIKETYKKLIPKNNHFFHVVKLPFDHFLGQKIKQAVLIQTPPDSKGDIHIDYIFPNIDNNNGFPKLALNIPFDNCEQSFTKFWESSSTPVERFTDDNRPYYKFDKNKCKLITEFKLITPVLFRTNVPHSVDNIGLKIRRAISLRFDHDPWDLFNK
jgi:hypothetical protein